MESVSTSMPVPMSFSMKRPAYSGPVELLAEKVQAEAVVDALLKDAAQLLIALNDDDALRRGGVRLERGGQAGGASAR